jgi:Glycosyltransferase
MKILLSANTSKEIIARKKLLKRLLEKGHSLYAVCSLNEKDASLMSELSVECFSIKINPRAKNPLNDIKLFLTYKKFFKQILPDVVLSYNIKPNIYGAMAVKVLGLNIIANITGLGKIFDRDSLIQKLVCNLYRNAFNFKKCFVFFQNNDDRLLFLNKQIIKSEKRTDVLPGSGVDLNFFNPKSIQSHTSYKKIIEFSFLGRLMITKGIRLFIEAANIISKKYDFCVFNIAGSYIENDPDFIQKQELEKAIQNKAIVYYGQVEDVKTFLAEHTDCVVFPSYYREGVPRVLLEASSMAKPLIVSDSIGTREPCKDGENGFLVKVNDIDDLTKKMIAFLDLDENKKEKMGIASRNIAETYFSDEIVVKKYLSKIENTEKENI